MNNKVLYFFREWLQFISATADLKLLKQISIVHLLLEKRHNYLSKILWPIVYWVIDKDISVNTSSTHTVQSVTSNLYINIASEQSDIISRLVTYRNNFYYMDPSESGSLTKRPIS